MRHVSFNASTQTPCFRRHTTPPPNVTCETRYGIVSSGDIRVVFIAPRLRNRINNLFILRLLLEWTAYRSPQKRCYMIFKTRNVRHTRKISLTKSKLTMTLCLVHDLATGFQSSKVEWFWVILVTYGELKIQKFKMYVFTR